MKKAEAEAIFVEQLLKSGIEWYCVSYHRGHYYWCFQTPTRQRYWTNLSKTSCQKLKIKYEGMLGDEE